MWKSFPVQMSVALRGRRARRNLRVLFRFLLILLAMIVAYSAIFHLLMLREGQEHTWFTGFYWTLTVMSTLGFGDITFHTDLGRAFSVLVLVSGTVFILVLLPFTFIEFFYQPWLDAQAAARAPRRISPEVNRHVILTHYDPVTSALIRRLNQYQIPYVLLTEEVEDALRLHDADVNVVVGAVGDPDTWLRVGVEKASLVVTTANDFKNTNVAFTIRSIAKDISILATAKDEASMDILSHAGVSHVLRFEEMIGQAFARRTVGGDALAHLIGRFDKLLVAESNAHRTPLVGKTIRDSGVREHAGLSVVGIWERGRFRQPGPDTEIRDNTILVLAGDAEALHKYNELFCIYNVSNKPVLILGGGRVGRATARHLAAREVDYRIVELLPERIFDAERTIIGNAADLETMEKAGIREAPAVLVTTHDDDLNIYLTLYCRSLQPDIQILSRATLERNVPTLHRAGADMVMSYAGTGASTIMNWLQRHKIITVAEGLDMFRVPVPKECVGKTLAESGIRERTGCTVVGVQTASGMEVAPEPTHVLSESSDLVMIATTAAEDRFLKQWGDRRRDPGT